MFSSYFAFFILERVEEDDQAWSAFFECDHSDSSPTVTYLDWVIITKLESLNCDHHNPMHESARNLGCGRFDPRTLCP